MAHHNNLVCFLIFILAFNLPSSRCLSVSFPFKGDLYVAEGREMSLKAAFQRDPPEKIVIVTWEFRKENYPMKRLVNLIDSTENPLDQHESMWREAEMTTEKFGIYIVTVTNDGGNQKRTSVIVKQQKKHDAPPVVTISLHCDAISDRTQWDIPKFYWLVDGLSVSNKTANLSEDGSKLYLTGQMGRNYTCIANSSLGTITSHYTIPGSKDCPTGGSGWSLWVVLVLVVIVTVLLVSLLRECRRKRRSFRQNGEGL